MSDNTKIGNLIPFTSDQSREEAVKNGKKGGLKSGEARREKRLLRSTLEKMLKDRLIVDGKKMSRAEAITVSLLNKAASGDVSAYLAIRDTVGEKPSDKQEVDSTVHVVMDKETEDFSG